MEPVWIYDCYRTGYDCSWNGPQDSTTNIILKDSPCKYEVIILSRAFTMFCKNKAGILPWKKCFILWIFFFFLLRLNNFISLVMFCLTFIKRFSHLYNIITEQSNGSDCITISVAIKILWWSPSNEIANEIYVIYSPPFIGFKLCMKMSLQAGWVF